MSGMNRSVFCLACGEIIAEADLASHIASNPTHALIPYHHNIPMGGSDPIGAVISGSLNGSKRLHVDGSRTDVSTPESGTPAQPFRTIQGAINYGVATFAGPFTICVEQALYVEEVVMPDYVTIDCPVGAALRRPPGPVPSDALTVTGTYGDPEPAFGATIIRGLRIVSDGDDGSGGHVESWCVRVVGDNSSAPATREPFVVIHVCGLDAYNEGNYLFCEGGAFLLTGDGGMGGDETGGVGVKLKPQPDLGAMCLCGLQMVAFGTNGLEIYENSFFVGNGTRFQAMNGHSSPTRTCIKMDATAGFSLVSIYQPSAMFGDLGSFIDAVGAGGGGPPSGLITVHGGYNDLFDGSEADAVNIRDGILFRFVDGGLQSGGGRGVVVDNAFLWIRNANVISGDGYALEIHGDDSHVDSIDTTYEGNSGGPGSAVPGPCTLVDVLTSSVSFDGGRMRGDGTVLDVQRGSAFLLGGLDLDPVDPAAVAYNVATGANLQRGHCNVRRGLRVVAPGASETLLPSGFGEVTVGFYNCIAKIGSTLTPPGGGQGWEQGSLWINPGDPTFQLYQNIGTQAAPVWKGIANGLMSGSGSPNGSVTGHAGLFYRDTDTDQLWVCVQNNSTIWIPAGSAGVSSYERIQMDTCGTQNLNGVPEAAPLVMPFSNTPIVSPYYTFLGFGVVRIEDDGMYRLSYNLAFEQDTGILLDGFSAGACWQYSLDSGATWNDFITTKTFDTIHGVTDDHGSMSLPPVEEYLTAGTLLRVVGFDVGSTGNCYINSTGPARNWSWARIERGVIQYGYSPATPSDWSAPAPTSVADAIDRIAAALAAHLGVPIL